MRVLLFLLFPFMLPAFSADNLLRWHDAQHFTVQASTPLKAKRAWKLCGALSQPERFILVIVNYGMQEAARRYGVDLKVPGGRRACRPVGYPASTNRPV
ncbi:hypothetical protein ACNKHL_05925 [Shigella flexneri]